MPIDVASLARHVAAEAEAGRFSGSVLVTDGTTPLLEVAHGHENRTTGTPITVQTRFGVASLCKAFTAVAIARLVERGVPRFDSPVMDVLPRALQPTHLSPRVTIHHLLCHTSGIGDYFDEDLLGAAAFEHVWDSVPCYRMRHVVDFLPLFAGLPPIAEPGAGFAYCGAGYVLLGLVLESLTSLAFAEAIEREVFQPAGMTESGYLAVDELHPHLAVGYIPPDGEHPVWRSNIFAIPPVGGPDGGAMCTARDVDRFLTALWMVAYWSGPPRPLCCSRTRKSTPPATRTPTACGGCRQRRLSGFC